MKSKIIYWLAIVLILEVGLLHLLTAQAEFEEAAYMGYLFMANFLGALAAAYGIFRNQLWGWLLGVFVAAGSVAGYIWSRTLGMPGMEVEEWLSPYGIVAMTVEGIFLVLFLFRPWRNYVDSRSFFTGKAKVFSSLAGVVVIAMIGIFAHQWDTATTQAYGYHVGSLEQVRDTPATSYTELEDEYGVQVSLVAVSMMDSIVDVRIKIIDPDKAHTLLQNQAALMVGDQTLILAPHMHSHNTTRLKTGKIFSIFFPTQQIVSPGGEISLVFGQVRVEPTVVK